MHINNENCLIIVSITFQVGCRVIQLLMETAYIQPPIDQLGDGPPDIRPAFVHTLKTITKEAQLISILLSCFILVKSQILVHMFCIN